MSALSSGEPDISQAYFDSFIGAQAVLVSITGTRPEELLKIQKIIYEHLVNGDYDSAYDIIMEATRFCYREIHQELSPTAERIKKRCDSKELKDLIQLFLEGPDSVSNEGLLHYAASAMGVLVWIQNEDSCQRYRVLRKKWKEIWLKAGPVVGLVLTVFLSLFLELCI